MRTGTWRLLAVVVVLVAATAVETPAATGAGAVLARYPYLSDLTATSVAVTWSTTSLDSTPGVVTYGPDGSSCTATTVAAGRAATTYTAFGETTPYYQHTVRLTGLSASTAYCYRVWSGSTAPTTALISEPPSSPLRVVTAAAPGATSSVVFDVLGDFGETSLTNGSPLGTYNRYQEALDSQIAATAKLTVDPATFAVSTGDIAYSDGTQTNYGDLNHPADRVGGAAEQSNVFDARYWGKVGGSLPLFATTGNHGRNGTFFSVWPSTTNVAASSGAYGTTVAYPAVDGLPAGSYPSDWYAFTVAGVRFYVLDADWTDLSQTAYPSLGTACRYGSCPTYQADRDLHWQKQSAEYTWLAADLEKDAAARGASALRIAFFHYPLRVDQNNWTTQQDVYLQNSPANPTGGADSLEALLSAGHVNLVFNGHAHLYQRNVPPPGGVISYVTGGGGGVPTNVAASSACSSTDAYARGWDPWNAAGSSCGSPAGGGAARPTSAAQAYSFLKVKVAGTDVTVTPIDSAGSVFDPVTYRFAPDSTAPTAPGSPRATRTSTTSTNVAVTLGAAAVDDTGVLAYDVYRDRTYRATVPATATSWTDATVPAGTHTWTVVARDYRDNASPESLPSAAVTIPDTTAPTSPTLTASSRAGAIDLSWSGAGDDVAVVGYSVYRDGATTALATGITGSAWTDSTVAAGSTHTYAVTATDAAGNVSPPSNLVTVTAAPAPQLGPPTHLSAAQLTTPGQVAITWAPPSVGSATSYDVARDGVALAAALTSTTFVDTASPDSRPATYTITAHDAYGTTAAASSAITPDWTAPTPPAGLTASALTATSATVSWGVSLDAVGTTGYTVVRTDASGTTTTVAVLGAGAGTSTTDTGLAAGAAYTWTVTARDAAGNTSSTATSAVMPVLADGFESGLLLGGANPWSAPTAGLVTEQGVVHQGGWAVEESSTGSPTWSSAQLPAAYRGVHASAWVLVRSRSTSAGFIKLRSATGAYIAYVYVNAAGYLAVRNDAGGVTHVSTSPVSTGQWHRVELALDTNPGGPVAITAALDGVPVTFSTPVGAAETLGTAPIGRVTLGDDVAGRTYDVAIDDLVVDQPR
ncbi:MAG: fibronectin type III domain-containing protein [Candidatus Nanopelagicales bacterium]